MLDTDFLSAVGDTITTWHVDVEAARLSPFSRLELGTAVQYAWRHPWWLPLLYVALSDRFSRGGDHHAMAVLGIDSSSGALSEPIQFLLLDNRPVHLTVNRRGSLLTIAYNEPSEVSLHRLEQDGRISENNRGALHAGAYAHHVRFSPDEESLIVSARGNDPEGNRNEDPGSLEIFRIRDSKLERAGTIAPLQGYGFGPRHVDFRPNSKWMYVSVERQNALQMFKMRDGTLQTEASFCVATLQSPQTVVRLQLAGAIHVSHDGRIDYVAQLGKAESPRPTTLLLERLLHFESRHCRYKLPTGRFGSTSVLCIGQDVASCRPNERAQLTP
ncbi:MAG: hypothetical protein CPDRYMAC_4746 [uncultured Paraburkholderia sp.]|nr:MAG: hypothetical protein CPDRYDRY_4660 [uncultured Paraburkholderia sp.]CAH2937966.1 MAG: hypothetical protein CPDRYMAC_4746 [uncultured Paraburkholderia sp.]